MSFLLNTPADPLTRMWSPKLRLWLFVWHGPALLPAGPTPSRSCARGVLGGWASQAPWVEGDGGSSPVSCFY